MKHDAQGPNHRYFEIKILNVIMIFFISTILFDKKCHSEHETFVRVWPLGVHLLQFLTTDKRWYPPVPEWKGLLLPASRGERPIIDSGRTPVAYSSTAALTQDVDMLASFLGSFLSLAV